MAIIEYLPVCCLAVAQQQAIRVLFYHELNHLLLLYAQLLSRLCANSPSYLQSAIRAIHLRHPAEAQIPAFVNPCLLLKSCTQTLLQVSFNIDPSALLAFRYS